MYLMWLGQPGLMLYLYKRVMLGVLPVRPSVMFDAVFKQKSNGTCSTGMTLGDVYNPNIDSSTGLISSWAPLLLRLPEIGIVQTCQAHQ